MDWLLKIILIIISISGVLAIVSPHSIWMISHGWKYKDAEPSDISLVLTRISGGVMIIAAVIVWFML